MHNNKSTPAIPTPEEEPTLASMTRSERRRARHKAEAAAREALQENHQHLGWVSRGLAWVHRGFPRGVPVNKTPAMAYVLRRRLDDHDVAVILDMLRRVQGEKPINQAQVEGVIKAVTEQIPDKEDVLRIYSALVDTGFDVDTFDADNSRTAQLARIELRLAELKEEKKRLKEWRAQLEGGKKKKKRRKHKD